MLLGFPSKEALAELRLKNLARPRPDGIDKMAGYRLVVVKDYDEATTPAVWKGNMDVLGPVAPAGVTRNTLALESRLDALEKRADHGARRIKLWGDPEDAEIAESVVEIIQILREEILPYLQQR